LAAVAVVVRRWHGVVEAGHAGCQKIGEKCIHQWLKKIKSDNTDNSDPLLTLNGTLTLIFCPGETPSGTVITKVLP